jgi:adenine specific DNA methylase Mod
MTRQERRNNLPSTPFCEQKQRFIEEFIESNHILMDLQNHQTQAVIDQDPEFARFDDLIHMAREKKDQAKYALMAHVERHHCYSETCREETIHEPDS